MKYEFYLVVLSINHSTSLALLIESSNRKEAYPSDHKYILEKNCFEWAPTPDNFIGTVKLIRLSTIDQPSDVSPLH